MSWESYLVVVALAVGLGFAGAQAALVLDRRRRRRPDAVAAVDGTGAADFALECLDANTWSLTNTGTAPARLVRVLPLAEGVDQWPPQPPPDAVSTATSKLMPTLVPGESLSVWLSRHDRGQQVLVSWTSETNVRMGPVALEVPAP